MEIKDKVVEWLTNLSNKIIHKPVKHICRACHHIFNEEEMSSEDSSICKECAKRE
tara:strand:- start:303 stop:467 length:165 start_codon:yes stop_codon:yes gene_type:complete